MIGMDEQVVFGEITAVGRVLDNKLCAGAMSEKKKRNHASNDVVRTIELRAVLRGYETQTLDVRAVAHTIGGPPSDEVADSKNREIEKVLHGGAAMIAANSPRTIRSRNASYTL